MLKKSTKLWTKISIWSLSQAAVPLFPLTGFCCTFLPWHPIQNSILMMSKIFILLIQAPNIYPVAIQHPLKCCKRHWQSELYKRCWIVKKGRRILGELLVKGPKVKYFLSEKRGAWVRREYIFDLKWKDFLCLVWVNFLAKGIRNISFYYTFSVWQQSKNIQKKQRNFAWSFWDIQGLRNQSLQAWERINCVTLSFPLYPYPCFQIELDSRWLREYDHIIIIFLT